MTDVPEGALRSDDGSWWWDDTAQQWRSVDGAAGSGGGDGDRAAARVAAGLPPSLDDLTADQRDQYLAEPTAESELLVAEVLSEIPELAMSGDEDVAA
jgi:hypothetical protein